MSFPMTERNRTVLAIMITLRRDTALKQLVRECGDEIVQVALDLEQLVLNAGARQTMAQGKKNLLGGMCPGNESLPFLPVACFFS